GAQGGADDPLAALELVAPQRLGRRRSGDLQHPLPPLPQGLLAMPEPEFDYSLAVSVWACEISILRESNSSLPRAAFRRSPPVTDKTGRLAAPCARVPRPPVTPGWHAGRRWPASRRRRRSPAAGAGAGLRRRTRAGTRRTATPGTRSCRERSAGPGRW